MIQHVCDRCKRVAGLHAHSLEIELVREWRKASDDPDRTIHLCMRCYDWFKSFLDGRPVHELDEETL